MQHLSKTHTLAVVVLLWCLGLSAAAQVAKYTVLVQTLTATYDGSLTLVGVLVSIIGLSGIVMGLIVGSLPDKVGIYRLLFTSGAVAVMCSLYQATNPNLYSLLLSRIIEGLSHLGIVVAAPTLIAVLVPENYRATAMTFWGTFYGVAFALTAWIAPPIILEYGPSGIVLIHAVFTFSVCVLLAVLLKSTMHTEELSHSPRPDSEPESIRARLRQFLAGIVGLHISTYCSPFIAAPSLGWMFYTPTFIAVISVLSISVGAENGYLATIMPLASILTSVSIVTLLLAFASAVNIVMGGFILSATLAFLLSIFPNNLMIIIALFGTLGLVQGASYAAIPQLNRNPHCQALSHGAMAQTGNFGNVCGVPILFFISDTFGIEAMLITVSCAYTLAFFLHLCARYMRGKNSLLL